MTQKRPMKSIIHPSEAARQQGHDDTAVIPPTVYQCLYILSQRTAGARKPCPSFPFSFDVGGICFPPVLTCEVESLCPMDWCWPLGIIAALFGGHQKFLSVSLVALKRSRHSRRHTSTAGVHHCRRRKSTEPLE